MLVAFVAQATSDRLSGDRQIVGFGFQFLVFSFWMTIGLIGDAAGRE